jgi:glycosyltransferase involved in cell wall biosynthesis
VRGRQSTNEYAEALRAVGISCEIIHEHHRFDLRGILDLTAIVRRRRPDVIEAHGHRELMYLLALRPFLRFKLVAYFHGWTETNLLTREESWLCAQVWKLAPILITVCRNFKERLCRRGLNASRIEVFYNGVNLDLCRSMPTDGDVRRELDLSEGAPLVLVIGRLSGEKGQVNFLRAFARIVERRPEAKAVIVGDGPDLGLLRALTRELQLECNVVFAGYQRNVRKFYEAADVLVVPSKSEGMPIVVLEGMVFGVPIVSTLVGGVPEIIEDGKNGLLVPTEDPAGLAQAVLRLIGDPALARQLAKTAREASLPKFTNTERCAQIAEYYRRITAQPSAR